jgi:sugar phosphate isomerase/epimerase
MCYGYDGDRALQQSLAGRPTSRRGLLRGLASGAAVAGVAATGLGGSPAHADLRPKPWKKIPPGKISIQLYTLRNAMGPGDSPGFDETLRRLARMGYPKVELAGYGERSASELRDFLDSLDIHASSSHDGISDSSAALERKLQNAVTLGQQYVVVPYLNSTSKSDWQAWAEQMNKEAERARSYGLRYGYHNHAHEFTIDLGDGLRPWDVLTSELDPRYVHLEADLYWVVRGGIESGSSDPEGFAIDTIREAPQKVLQYHVKDRHVTDGDMADLGTGMIDFKRIFRAHAVQEYIVENDTPDVTPLHTARVGYDYLRSIRL